MKWIVGQSYTNRDGVPCVVVLEEDKQAVICVCQGNDAGCPELDARLIAAAPELLSALKGLLPLFYSPTGREKTGQELIKDVLDAIAKAEVRK